MPSNKIAERVYYGTPEEGDADEDEKNDRAFVRSVFCGGGFPQENGLTDAQIKDALARQNAFGKFLTCRDDGTFVSRFRTRGGDGYYFEGAYRIQDGVITFSDVKGTEWASGIISTDDNGNLNFGSKYRYVPDADNGTFMGCLCSLEDESRFWSVKEIPEDMITEISGIKVFRVKNDLSITENLKMRDDCSLDGKTVEIQRCDFRCGAYVRQARKIVFRGMVVRGIAKTVRTETIDGITAPWYLIEQRSHDSLGRNEGDVHRVWIFGGYVKEHLPGEAHENPQELKESVGRAGLKLYQ